jgi:hypothetical protein
MSNEQGTTQCIFENPIFSLDGAYPGVLRRGSGKAEKEGFGFVLLTVADIALPRLNFPQLRLSLETLHTFFFILVALKYHIAAELDAVLKGNAYYKSQLVSQRHALLTEDANRC